MAELSAPLALDCLYADPSVSDPVPLWADLVSAMLATTAPEQTERPEYHVFLPVGWREDESVLAALEPRLEACARAGLAETTERLRYEWLVGESVVPQRSTRLRLSAESDDSVFLDLFARVIEGSLDAGSVRAAAQGGPAAAASADLAAYHSMPGERNWWRVGLDGSGAVVGFAIPSANAGGPVVGYLGVVPEQRGHGYVDDLLTEITAFLAERGAERIVADTDLGNTPMAGAFERASYRNFAVRMVASEPAP